MSIFGKRIQTRVITIDDNGKVTDIKREPKPTRNKKRTKTGGGFSFFSFFKSSHTPYNDNGREFNPATGNLEYVKPSSATCEEKRVDNSKDVDGVDVSGWWS